MKKVLRTPWRRQKQSCKTQSPDKPTRHHAVFTVRGVNSPKSQISQRISSSPSFKSTTRSNGKVEIQSNPRLQNFFNGSLYSNFHSQFTGTQCGPRGSTSRNKQKTVPKNKVHRVRLHNHLDQNGAAKINQMAGTRALDHCDEHGFQHESAAQPPRPRSPPVQNVNALPQQKLQQLFH